MKRLLLVLFIAFTTIQSYAATLVSAADGNWLTASTWGVGEAGASAIQTTISASTNTTASYVWSSAFTCTNLDEVDGVLVHTKSLTATGTVTIGLSDDNGSTAAKEVSVNATDIPTSETWMFFKFDSALTCDGGSDYKVGVVASSANNAAFYRDGTAGNWARVPRTTATAAPGAGDNIYAAGDWTAAATVAARVVTMNALQSSITDHGTLDIGESGTLTYAVTASTWFYARFSGAGNIWSGGLVNIGTVASPMPSDSRGDLNFDSGSVAQYGLTVRSGGSLVMQGATMSYVSALLAADVSVNGTELTTNVSTGWADNDVIALASTTRTFSQTEEGALNGAASGTTLTVDGFGGAGGGVAYAHSGTSPAQAEVMNLTRNVSIFGASATNTTYLVGEAGSVIDLDYAELYWLGSGSGNTRGIYLQTNSTGSFNAAYCAFHDYTVAAASIGVFVTGADTDNVTIDHTMIYKTYSSNIWLGNAVSGTHTITNNILAYNVSGGYNIYTVDVGATITGNTGVSGSAGGFSFAEAGGTVGTIANNTFHSSNGTGVTMAEDLAPGSTISGFTVWRNNNYGFYITNAAQNSTGVVIDGLTAFGNLTANLSPQGSMSGLTVNNFVSNGDSSFATANGFYSGNLTFQKITFNSADFSTASGILTATTNDLNLQGADWFNITCNYCKFGAATLITGSAMYFGSYLRAQGYDQTAGDHRTFAGMGGGAYATIQTDSSIYNTAAPSEKLTPASASIKLESGLKCKVVASGSTVNFTVQVRESVAGDGTDYNGNRLRLIEKRNDAVGITADSVLDTGTVSSEGAFEQLTGTSSTASDDGVICAVVDGDGTTGWWNVDDWQ